MGYYRPRGTIVMKHADFGMCPVHLIKALSLSPLLTSCTKYPIESNALWEVHGTFSWSTLSAPVAQTSGVSGLDTYR